MPKVIKEAQLSLIFSPICFRSLGHRLPPRQASFPWLCPTFLARFLTIQETKTRPFRKHPTTAKQTRPALTQTGGTTPRTCATTATTQLGETKMRGCARMSTGFFMQRASANFATYGATTTPETGLKVINILSEDINMVFINLELSTEEARA